MHETEGIMNSGEKIRLTRKLKNMTQKELGEKCGINEANIRKYESGRQIPKLETINKIAVGLGVSPDSLLPDEFEKAGWERVGWDSEAKKTVPLSEEEKLELQKENLEFKREKTPEEIHAYNVELRAARLQEYQILLKYQGELKAGRPDQAESGMHEYRLQLIEELSRMMNNDGLEKVVNYLIDLTKLPEYLI